MKISNVVSFIAGIAVASIVMIGGCQKVNTVNDPLFVQSADTFVNQTVGPEYEAYVMDDPDLGPVGMTTQLREDRLQNLRVFRGVVLEAKTEIDELQASTE